MFRQNDVDQQRIAHIQSGGSPVGVAERCRPFHPAGQNRQPETSGRRTAGLLAAEQNIGHIQQFRVAVRRGRQRQVRVVPRPRLFGEHVRYVQEGERPRKSRRLVPHRSQAPPERHRRQRAGPAVLRQQHVRHGDRRRQAQGRRHTDRSVPCRGADPR